MQNLPFCHCFLFLSKQLFLQSNIKALPNTCENKINKYCTVCRKVASYYLSMISNLEQWKGFLLIWLRYNRPTCWLRTKLQLKYWAKMRCNNSRFACIVCSLAPTSLKCGNLEIWQCGNLTETHPWWFVQSTVIGRVWGVSHLEKTLSFPTWSPHPEGDASAKCQK